MKMPLSNYTYATKIVGTIMTKLIYNHKKSYVIINNTIQYIAVRMSVILVTYGTTYKCMYNNAQYKLVACMHQLICINTFISSIKLSALMHHFMSSVYVNIKNQAMSMLASYAPPETC